jgi:hypothetical protein
MHVRLLIVSLTNCLLFRKELKEVAKPGRVGDETGAERDESQSSQQEAKYNPWISSDTSGSLDLHQPAESQSSQQEAKYNPWISSDTSGSLDLHQPAEKSALDLSPLVASDGESDASVWSPEGKYVIDFFYARTYFHLCKCSCT